MAVNPEAATRFRMTMEDRQPEIYESAVTARLRTSPAPLDVPAPLEAVWLHEANTEVNQWFFHGSLETMASVDVNVNNLDDADLRGSIRSCAASTVLEAKAALPTLVYASEFARVLHFIICVIRMLRVAWESRDIKRSLLRKRSSPCGMRSTRRTIGAGTSRTVAPHWGTYSQWADNAARQIWSEVAHRKPSKAVAERGGNTATVQDEVVYRGLSRTGLRPPGVSRLRVWRLLKAWRQNASEGNLLAVVLAILSVEG